MKVIGSIIVEWDGNDVSTFRLVEQEMFYTCEGILRRRDKVDDREREATTEDEKSR